MWVVSFGCILWGVMTAAFSAAPSLNFWSMLVWSVTGLGLALVIPNVQSVIAGVRRCRLVISRAIFCQADALVVQLSLCRAVSSATGYIFVGWVVLPQYTITSVIWHL